MHTDVIRSGQLRVVVIAHAYNLEGRIAPFSALGDFVDLTLIGPREHPDGALTGSSDSEPLTVIDLPALHLGRLQFILRGLPAALRQCNADVICIEYDPWHVQFMQTLMTVKIIRSPAKIVLVVKKNTYRASNSALGNAKRIVSQWGLSKCSAIIAASQMTRDMYVRELKAPGSLLVIQPHLAVDVERFAPPPQRPTRETVRIGFVGKIGETKGIPELLSAFEKLRTSTSRTVELWLAGAISDATLPSSIFGAVGVHHTGEINNEDLHKFLQTIDVFVMPARILPDHQEHDGRAVLEAMSVGIPCVVSDSGILPEIVDSTNGRVFPAGNVAQLADHLNELVESLELRNTLGSQARQKAKETVSPQVVGHERAALFQRIMEVPVNEQQPEDRVGYTARSEYLDEQVVQNYIPNRFTGPLGKYRYWREQHAVNGLIEQIPANEIDYLLDCPTGIGRWLPNLASLQPNRIAAVDVSPTMLKQAQTVTLPGIAIKYREGVAEKLPFEDGSFDLVFCHALLKHLPDDASRQVIHELARVSSKFIIVTASVKRGPAGLLRSFRHAGGAFALSKDYFDGLLSEARLSVIDSRKASTPIGVEFSYLLRKLA